MAIKCFNIIFSGKIVDNFEVQEVRKNLSSLFKMDEKRIERLFSGKRIVLQRNVNRETALKYQKAFQKAGAICEIDPVKIHGTSISHSITHKQESLRTYGHKEIICPACGHKQEKLLECLKCGIIISKYKRKIEHKPSNSLSTTSSPISTQSTKSLSKSIVIVLALVIFFSLYSIFNWWKGRSISYGPGLVAPNIPEQTETYIKPFTFKDYRIIPLANFHISARVLSIKKYHFGRESDLSPIDLALGWGQMSDETVLEMIKIKQSNRFYFWSTNQFPIHRKQIETSSANMHIIPANDTIFKYLKNIRKGHIVNFTGYLVKVMASDGWHWQSSLTRSDTGNGSCEVIFVKELEIL